MLEAMFTPSPEQQAVIDHRGGHLQVIIVEFTFTERAAESLKTRITRKVAKSKGTF